jgi:hypothetical protein
MLLTLFSYYREYAAQNNEPSVHLVFIEEPEAHLHPQMQETFIHQLEAFKQRFPEADVSPRPWNPQFLVTTHSAHIANRVSFSAIRYFRLIEAVDSNGAARSKVLNLAEAPAVDKEFLHKYLTLTRADLFFADKAILVEGASERIFLPAAIAKFDAEIRGDGSALSSQYVTLMEVGGAHAHLFYPFLEFLGLQSLIITDIDSVSPNSNGKLEKCCVSEGTASSNKAIEAWFDEKSLTPAQLLQKAESSPPVQGKRCLAYQVPERLAHACGRTFEDAFILANLEFFDLPKDQQPNPLQLEEQAREIAISYKKSDFALKYAVETEGWEIPRYIRRGLEWLLGEARKEADSSGARPTGDESVSDDGQVALS